MCILRSSQLIRVKFDNSIATWRWRRVKQHCGVVLTCFFKHCLEHNVLVKMTFRSEDQTSVLHASESLGPFSPQRIRKNSNQDASLFTFFSYSYNSHWYAITCAIVCSVERWWPEQLQKWDKGCDVWHRAAGFAPGQSGIMSLAQRVVSCGSTKLNINVQHSMSNLF